MGIIYTPGPGPSMVWGSAAWTSGQSCRAIVQTSRRSLDLPWGNLQGGLSPSSRWGGCCTRTISPMEVLLILVSGAGGIGVGGTSPWLTMASHTCSICAPWCEITELTFEWKLILLMELSHLCTARPKSEKFVRKYCSQTSEALSYQNLNGWT